MFLIIVTNVNIEIVLLQSSFLDSSLRDHPLTNLDCARPFIVTVEGILTRNLASGVILYPANER